MYTHTYVEGLQLTHMVCIYIFIQTYALDNVCVNLVEIHALGGRPGKHGT